jgi:enoyl-[acyl-carrier protein] reductase I
VANKKSIAFSIGQVLSQSNANVVYSVRSKERLETVSKILTGSDIFVCDVEREQDIRKLAEDISQKYPRLHGIVHSIAFANYEEGLKPFHETRKNDFLQSIDISCYSLIAIANEFKTLLDDKASIVTISISTNKIAAEPYGFMAPVKAALDSTICFLAKSFSAFSEVRFNSVNAGPLKTSASAGIPGSVDYYLYTEKLTLRKKILTAQEVANTAVFLLSDRSSGINAQGIIVDCGMSVNYFDKDIIDKTTRIQ